MWTIVDCKWWVCRYSLYYSLIVLYVWKVPHYTGLRNGGRAPINSLLRKRKRFIFKGRGKHYLVRVRKGILRDKRHQCQRKESPVGSSWTGPTAGLGLGAWLVVNPGSDQREVLLLCASSPEHLTTEHYNICCCLFEGCQGRKKSSYSGRRKKVPREQKSWWLLCLRRSRDNMDQGLGQRVPVGRSELQEGLRVSPTLLLSA